MTLGGPHILPRAFFLPASDGHRFCLFHPPQAAQRSRILFLHPFAEEMHAARRVVAQQCRALAADGHAVLQIDLLGCGDSSGDFGNASWSTWVQDAQLGLQWLQQHTAPQPTWLWGLRAGALLACSAARAWPTRPADSPLNLLLWQPLASGAQQLQQFLRLHAAAQWLGRDALGEPPAQSLAAGRHAHVAGYRLSPVLASELDKLRMDLPTGTGRIEVVDMPSSGPANPSPWLLRQQTQWEAAGWRVRSRATTSPAFWQNVVESSLPEALDRTTREALT